MLNTIRDAAARDRAQVVLAALPFPTTGDDELVAAVLASVTPRTRLAILSHVTSPTGLVLPIERIVRELDARGIDTLVDGAHAPGMVPLALDELGGRVLHGQRPQVAVRAQGRGVPVGPGRPARAHPSHDRVARRQRHAHGPADGSASNSTGSGPATRPRRSRCPQRSTGWPDSSPAAGPPSWPRTERSRSRHATGSWPRSAVRHRSPTP